MRNIKLTIEYDGKKFNGWQKQPDKLNIQGEIEKAIGEITGEEIDLIASGRTDAGVHSLGQTANFKTENESISIEKFPIAINSKLKKSIVIKSAEEVDEKLHFIMESIHEACVKFGTQPDGTIDYVKGANIAGFMKVAQAMLEQGII